MSNRYSSSSSASRALLRFANALAFSGGTRPARCSSTRTSSLRIRVGSRPLPNTKLSCSASVVLTLYRSTLNPFGMCRFRHAVIPRRSTSDPKSSRPAASAS